MLADQEGAPLPARITPHGLRRTFASLLYAVGEDPPTVMAEMGHTNPGLALRIYAQAMRRDDAEREQLRALVDGGQLAVIGSPGNLSELDEVEQEPEVTVQSPGLRRALGTDRRGCVR